MDTHLADFSFLRTTRRMLTDRENSEKNLRSHSSWESPTVEGEQRHRVDLETDRSRTSWNRPSRTEGEDDCRDSERDFTRVSWLLIHLVNAFFWISSRSSTNERLVETILSDDQRALCVRYSMRFEYDETKNAGERKRESEGEMNDGWWVVSFNLTQTNTSSYAHAKIRDATMIWYVRVMAQAGERKFPFYVKRDCLHRKTGKHMHLYIDGCMDAWEHITRHPIKITNLSSLITDNDDENETLLSLSCAFFVFGEWPDSKASVVTIFSLSLSLVLEVIIAINIYPSVMDITKSISRIVVDWQDGC